MDQQVELLLLVEGVAEGGAAVLVQTVQTMEAFGCGPFVALAAFLIPLWLVYSAEDDLRTYEEMGSIITPEELEAKRRELGLRRPAGK